MVVVTRSGNGKAVRKSWARLRTSRAGPSASSRSTERRSSNRVAQGNAAAAATNLGRPAQSSRPSRGQRRSLELADASLLLVVPAPDNDDCAIPATPAHPQQPLTAFDQASRDAHPRLNSVASFSSEDEAASILHSLRDDAPFTNAAPTNTASECTAEEDQAESLLQPQIGFGNLRIEDLQGETDSQDESVAVTEARDEQETEDGEEKEEEDDDDDDKTYEWESEIQFTLSKIPTIYDQDLRMFEGEKDPDILAALEDLKNPPENFYTSKRAAKLVFYHASRAYKKVMQRESNARLARRKAASLQVQPHVLADLCRAQLSTNRAALWLAMLWQDRWRPHHYVPLPRVGVEVDRRRCAIWPWKWYSAALPGKKVQRLLQHVVSKRAAAGAEAPVCVRGPTRRGKLDEARRAQIRAFQEGKKPRGRSGLCNEVCFD